jgi:hypothetical protein
MTYLGSDVYEIDTSMSRFREPAPRGALYRGGFIED